MKAVTRTNQLRRHAHAIAEIVAISDQALEERPDDPVASATSIYTKAIALATQGDENALTDLVNQLETIVARSPTAHEARLLLVRAYKHVERLEDVLPVLEGALSLDPFNPALQYELGTAYLELDRLEEARAALESSLDLEPEQPNAYIYLGIVSLMEGDGVGYVGHFLKAVDVDPKDHEIPGMLALFLYRLGVVEVADEFRERVLTLSPTSTIAYELDIARARATGDQAASIAAARRAVTDDIEDRHLAFGGAVQYLIRTAVGEGRIDEELAGIESQPPGIFDVDAAQVTAKFRNAQGTAFVGWVAALPREEVIRRLDVMLAYAESIGVDPIDDPNAHIAVLVLRGQVDEAIEVALNEVFTRPVAMNLNWRDTLLQPQYTELVADARVQEAMQRWEDEEQALRGSVAAYFAVMHASR